MNIVISDITISNYQGYCDGDERNYTYERCKFENIHNWNFEDCTFIDCIFDIANMVGAKFNRCVFRNCRMIRMLACKVAIKNSEIIDCDLSYSYFGFAEFADVKVKSCNMVKCNLYEIKCVHTDFEGINFTDASLYRAFLHHVSFPRCILRNTDLMHTCAALINYGTAIFDGTKLYCTKPDVESIGRDVCHPGRNHKDAFTYLKHCIKGDKGYIELYYMKDNMENQSVLPCMDIAYDPPEDYYGFTDKIKDLLTGEIDRNRYRQTLELITPMIKKTIIWKGMVFDHSEIRDIVSILITFYQEYCLTVNVCRDMAIDGDILDKIEYTIKHNVISASNSE